MVSSTDNVGNYNAITCPNQNNSYVFISYFNSTDDTVEVVASNNKGSGWTPPVVVDSSVNTTICGTDIEVHDYNSGPLWIAYTDASTNLGVALCDSYTLHFTSWTNSTIDSNVYLSDDIDIAYNSDANDMYIAYGDVDLDYLWLLKSTDGGQSWLTRQGVDTGGDAGLEPSIAVFNNLVFITHATQIGLNYRLIKSKTAGSEW